MTLTHALVVVRRATARNQKFCSLWLRAFRDWDPFLDAMLSRHAVKHGTLNTIEGRVDVEWLVDGEQNLTMNWEESGGPAVAGEPARMGYGTRLIQSPIDALGGSLTKIWEPGGMRAEIVLPLSQLA